MMKRLLCFSLLFCLAFPLPSQAKKIAILISKNLPAYADILNGMEKALTVEHVQSNMQGDTGAGKNFLSGQTDADLVVAIGPEALLCAQQGLHGKPLAYAMVFQAAQYQGPSRGILLQVSIANQLAKIRDLFPKIKKIGLVYDPRYSLKSVNQAREICESLGFELEALPAQDPEEISGLLKKMKQDNIEVLWSVLDRTTIAPQVATEEIKFGLAEKIPFIGLSEYQVEAGALAAFSVDFASLGRQTARLANTMLKDTSPSSAAPESPEEVMVYINSRTQKSLGLFNLPQLPNISYKDLKE